LLEIVDDSSHNAAFSSSESLISAWLIRRVQHSAAAECQGVPAQRFHDSAAPVAYIQRHSSRIWIEIVAWSRRDFGGIA